jgi:hypothetical protein
MHFPLIHLVLEKGICMNAPHPLKRLAEDKVRILEGGGCTALFGIPFFAAGVFLLLVSNRALPMQSSEVVPGWGWLVLVMMGLVLPQSVGDWFSVEAGLPWMWGAV